LTHHATGCGLSLSQRAVGGEGEKVSNYGDFPQTYGMKKVAGEWASYKRQRNDRIGEKSTPFKRSRRKLMGVDQGKSIQG